MEATLYPSPGLRSGQSTLAFGVPDQPQRAKPTPRYAGERSESVDHRAGMRSTAQQGGEKRRYRFIRSLPAEPVKNRYAQILRSVAAMKVRPGVRFSNHSGDIGNCVREFAADLQKRASREQRDPRAAGVQSAREQSYQPVIARPNGIEHGPGGRPVRILDTQPQLVENAVDFSFSWVK